MDNNMPSDYSLPHLEMPELPVIDPPTNHIWADEQIEILKSYIQEFEKTLDEEHEVGIMLTNFGQSVLLEVTNIISEPPVLVVFKGFVNEQRTTLIQHINQLNFMLTTIKKEPNRPKRKIGFGRD